MQVSVSARHGSLQLGDQAIVEEKVAKLRRIFDKVNAIVVTIDLEHLEKPNVEIKVSTEKVGQFVATAEATTVLAAIDSAIPKMEQQLRRAKEKFTKHQATGLGHVDAHGADESI